MKRLGIIWGLAILAVPAWSALIQTEHFTDPAQIPITGAHWVTRVDTERMHLNELVGASPDGNDVPYPSWESGQQFGFQVIYHPSEGRAVIRFDYGLSCVLPVSLDSATNGFLVTAYADGQGRTVNVNNFRLFVTDSSDNNHMVPPLNEPAVDDPAQAPATDYVLIHVSDLPDGLPLAHGFILGGTATFTWTGDKPPPLEQWFEIMPVVIVPEPGSLGLVALGAAALLMRRR